MSDDTKQLLAKYEPKEVKAIKPDRQVYRLRFSPCGKFLVGAGLDATVRRWDAASADYTELPALKGHHGWVSAIAFHPKDALLFTADSWGQLRSWKYDTDQPATVWSVEQAHDGWLRSVAVSPDGATLATCGMDRVVRLWSTRDGKKLHELTGHAPGTPGSDDVYAVAWSPDGKTLVSGDAKGVLKVWDPATGQATRDLDASALYKLHRLQDLGGLRMLMFDADGKRLFAAGSTPASGATFQGTPTVLVFDFASGKVTKMISLGQAKNCFVEDAAVHADGFLMAVTSGTPGDGQFLFARPDDDKPFFTNTKLANCHALAVHPDGRRLAVAATNTGSNGNGRQLGKDGEYPGNFSPISVMAFPGGDKGEQHASS
jgi:WD40 repeat protein